MKVGDTVPVNIGAHEVGRAEVKEIDLKNNTVTLLAPARLIVMGLRSELTDLPGSEPEKETLITGVDRASGGSAADSSSSDNDTSGASTASTDEQKKIESVDGSVEISGDGSAKISEGVVDGEQVSSSE